MSDAEKIFNSYLEWFTLYWRGIQDDIIDGEVTDKNEIRRIKEAFKNYAKYLKGVVSPDEEIDIDKIIISEKDGYYKAVYRDFTTEIGKSINKFINEPEKGVRRHIRGIINKKDGVKIYGIKEVTEKGIQRNAVSEEYYITIKDYYHTAVSLTKEASETIDYAAEFLHRAKYCNHSRLWDQHTERGLPIFETAKYLFKGTDDFIQSSNNISFLKKTDRKIYRL